jgi:hypothetical protein
MIRYASRLYLVACVAVPCVAGAQAPWRQVYKDSDLTVIFDTATVVLQSPGTWSTVTSWDYARPRITEQKAVRAWSGARALLGAAGRAGTSTLSATCWFGTRRGRSARSGPHGLGQAAAWNSRQKRLRIGVRNSDEKRRWPSSESGQNDTRKDRPSEGSSQEKAGIKIASGSAPDLQKEGRG